MGCERDRVAVGCEVAAGNGVGQPVDEATVPFISDRGFVDFPGPVAWMKCPVCPNHADDDLVQEDWDSLCLVQGGKFGVGGREVEEGVWVVQHDVCRF